MHFQKFIEIVDLELEQLESNIRALQFFVSKPNLNVNTQTYRGHKESVAPLYGVPILRLGI